jgi:uncharacterized protein (DUF427 family)
MAEPPTGTAGARFEPTQKWVRARFGDTFVADSRRAMLLWEPPRGVPLYYFPVDDARLDVLEPSKHRRPSEVMGEATYYNLRVGDRVAENAAWRYLAPAPGAPDASSYVTFKWDQLDAWFEEDDEVFVHPRDPHHRIDVLNSSRHVRIEAEGEIVAETRRPRLLFETGLPVRYYIPKLDVRMDLLSPSKTVTQCPYKGSASHYNVKVGDAQVEDIAWSYVTPLPETARIENLVSFYNERVDALYVDGELQEKPATQWSRPAK